MNRDTVLGVTIGEGMEEAMGGMLGGSISEARSPGHGLAFLPGPGYGHERRSWIDGPRAKRALDVAGASTLIVFFLPILALIALVLALGGGGGVLYGHQRLGRGKVAFRCLKFRTMHADGDRILLDHLSSDPELMREWMQNRKLRRDPRVTWLGRLLRKSSLDELPQLLNVLRGEMSLVGPRPIVEGEEARNYGEQLDHCLSLRPGLTGIWQVSGRNHTTYAERVALDARYCRNRTMRLDLVILVRTVRVVMTGDGAY